MPRFVVSVSLVVDAPTSYLAELTMRQACTPYAVGSALDVSAMSASRQFAPAQPAAKPPAAEPPASAPAPAATFDPITPEVYASLSAPRYDDPPGSEPVSGGGGDFSGAGASGDF